jgi:hypothetical protein
MQGAVDLEGLLREVKEALHHVAAEEDDAFFDGVVSSLDVGDLVRLAQETLDALVHDVEVVAGGALATLPVGQVPEGDFRLARGAEVDRRLRLGDGPHAEGGVLRGLDRGVDQVLGLGVGAAQLLQEPLVGLSQLLELGVVIELHGSDPLTRSGSGCDAGLCAWRRGPEHRPASA